METRPYKSPSDVPDAVPDSKKAQFMEVWNSAYAKAKKDGKSDDDAEKSAFAQAWGVIGKEEKIMQAKRELRFIPSVEIRISQDGKTLSGYAAKFDSWTQIGDPEWGFQECVRSGAFKGDIEAGADVRCLFNHDVNCLLGRTASKTLRLKEDANGLYYNCDLPDTQLGKDIPALIARGDLSGCSFGFEPISERWTEEKREDGKVMVKRELQAVKLYDIGPATFPAYEETEVHIRSLADQHRTPGEKPIPAEMNPLSDDIARKLAAIRLAAEIEFSKTR